MKDSKTSKLLALLEMEYNDILQEEKTKYEDFYRSMNLPDLYDMSSDDDDDKIEELEEMILLTLIEYKKESTNDKKRKRDFANKLYFTNPITGDRSIMTYEYSVWYGNYVQNPSPDNPAWAKQFRTRFRLPYSEYLKLVDEVKESPMFNKWTNTTHKVTHTTTSVELLILCCLRYLGRGWTFYDLHESCSINRETMRQFSTPSSGLGVLNYIRNML